MLSRTTAAAGRVARFGSVLPGRNVCRATPTRPLRPTPYSTLGVAKEKITDEFFSAEIPITEYKNVDSKDTKTASPASSVKGSKIVPRPWLPESLRIGQPSFKNPNIIQEDLISIERLAEIWPGLRYFLIPRDARSKSIDTLSGMLTTWFKSKQLRKIATNKTLSEAELLGLVNSAEFKNSVNWQKKDFLEDCAETLARTIVDIGGRERPQKGTRTSRAQWPRPKAYTPEALVETLRLAFDSGKSKYFIRPDEKSLLYLRSLVNHIPARDIVEYLHEEIGLELNFEGYNDRVRKMLIQGRKSEFEQWQEIQQAEAAKSQELWKAASQSQSQPNSKGITLISHTSRFNRHRLTFLLKESGKRSDLQSYIIKQIQYRVDLQQYIDRKIYRDNRATKDIPEAEIKTAILNVMKKHTKNFQLLAEDIIGNVEKFLHNLDREIENLKWLQVMFLKKNGEDCLKMDYKRTKDTLKSVGLRLRTEKMEDDPRQRRGEPEKLPNKSSGKSTTPTPPSQKTPSSYQETTIWKSPLSSAQSLKPTSRSQPREPAHRNAATYSPLHSWEDPYSYSSSNLNHPVSSHWNPPPKPEDLTPEMNWPECEFMPAEPEGPSELSEQSEQSEQSGSEGRLGGSEELGGSESQMVLGLDNDEAAMGYGRLGDVMARVKRVMEQGEEGDWRKPKTEGILVQGKPWQRGLSGL